MTPEQWAETIGADIWDRFNRGEPPAESGELKKRIADVVRRAVEEERGACAKVADDYICKGPDELIDTNIATAIRARGEGENVTPNDQCLDRHQRSVCHLPKGHDGWHGDGVPPVDSPRQWPA